MAAGLVLSMCSSQLHIASEGSELNITIAQGKGTTL